MATAAPLERPRELRADVDPATFDQRAILRGVSWQDFETILAIRGDRAGSRLYYLEGAIEILNPSVFHENHKTKLARLLEAWSDEEGLPLEGFGSWTLKNAALERGAEPDECYILGSTEGKQVPDLAIEVEWTRGGLDKLSIYQGLGIPEVWTVRRDLTVAVHLLGGGGYVASTTSALLPGLDVAWHAGFLATPTQSEAVKQMRAAMRGASTEASPRGSQP